MAGHGIGNALAARQPGPDELEGVGAVDAGPRLAARRPAGAARLQQHPVRLASLSKKAAGLPGGRVDLVDPAVQAHRLLAAAGRAHLRLPPLKAHRVARADAQVLDEPRIKAPAPCQRRSSGFVAASVLTPWSRFRLRERDAKTALGE
jgi:hypothetical protein